MNQPQNTAGVGGAQASGGTRSRLAPRSSCPALAKEHEGAFLGQVLGAADEGPADSPLKPGPRRTGPDRRQGREQAGAGCQPMPVTARAVVQLVLMALRAAARVMRPEQTAFLSLVSMPSLVVALGLPE
ncbi:hypothetical protein [Kitasatospora phosalacinea]|uniref:hypothetical protein n=1 Tax=Kitasatospora phosalacinea TaxID=2065 RepID=UPI0025525CC1|nr:hypothetical protein [Kitasatospora phosalacinea]